MGRAVGGPRTHFCAAAGCGICTAAFFKGSSFRHNSPLTNTIHANAYSANEFLLNWSGFPNLALLYAAPAPLATNFLPRPAAFSLCRFVV